MQNAPDSLDPAGHSSPSGPASAQAQLANLVFDRLVEIDDAGVARPMLAESWRISDDGQTWTLTLRQDARFPNGDLLAPSVVADSLRAANPSWTIVVSRSRAGSPEPAALIISGSPPDLLFELAQTRNSIAQRMPDGSLAGTGPFRVDLWQARRRALLKVNASDWRGRAFLDGIEIQMNRPAASQLVDLQLEKADLIEIPPEQYRQAARAQIRMSSSAPQELVALVFSQASSGGRDEQLRRSLAQAIGRDALWNLVLQKQGEPAAGLLPQWSSGTEFLFSSAPSSPPHPLPAKQLWPQIPRSIPMVLGYDAADPLARAVAQRVVVDAREAGISVNAQPISAGRSWDAQIERLPMASPDPAAALSSFLTSLSPLGGFQVRPLSASASSSEIYQREHEVLASYQVVPLAHLPVTYGLSSRVRDWTLSKLGAWRLGDVWLDGESR